LVNAIVAGEDKYGLGLNLGETIEQELQHIENHIAAIRRGEVHDQNDGQTHTSSIGLRAIKIHKLQCPAGG
jgi:hypothetical protein